MDEVFGEENFVTQITYTQNHWEQISFPQIFDYILWYARKKNESKVAGFTLEKGTGEEYAFQLR